MSHYFNNNIAGVTCDHSVDHPIAFLPRGRLFDLSLDVKAFLEAIVFLPAHLVVLVLGLNLLLECVDNVRVASVAALFVDRVR